MGKIDAIKEFIGFLKSIFITLVVIDSSLIAWLFQNYLFKRLNLDFYAIEVIILIVFITIMLILLLLKILKEIQKLKEL